MTIHTGNQPCMWATCDLCGEGDNWDYGSSFHYDNEVNLRQQLDSAGWIIQGERSLCESCCSELVGSDETQPSVEEMFHRLDARQKTLP